MEGAVFVHTESQRTYTVVLKATASFVPGTKLKDYDVGYIRRTDHGAILVALPFSCDFAPIVQTQDFIENGDECVVYRGEDNSLWVRKVSEFTDGRFEPKNPRAACMMPVQWHLGAKLGG